MSGPPTSELPPTPAPPPAGTAPAPPAGPDEAEVRAAQETADAVVDRLVALADRLATAQARVDAARAASDIALDTYQAEQAEHDAAVTAAQAAAGAAEQARAAVETARGELAAFARAGYIQRTTDPGLQALLGAGNPTQLLERMTLLGRAGTAKADAVVRFEQARRAADDAAARAGATRDRADDLARQAAAALAAAEEVEAGAHRQAAEVARERAGLLAELAAAQAQLLPLLAPEAALALEQRLAGIRGSLEDVVLDLALGEPAGAGSTPVAAAALAAAAGAVGTPYAWGGGTPSGPGVGFGVDAGVVGFDCSGLTRFAYAQAGVVVARNSRAQFATLPKVAPGDLRPGDLVFWATDPRDPATIHHVALYLGGDRVIEAPHSGARVTVRPMYWTGYAGAVRPSA